MAILARHAVLVAAGMAWRELRGGMTMVEMNLPTQRATAPESCATCRFRVEVVRSAEGFVVQECRAEPPRPRSPFPYTVLAAWCGFWDAVPDPGAGEPAHYAAARD